ncbi:hypothetical protein CDL12_09685 [Handroanthus impetiginosus]|uniref:Knottin scorpion toxin-like domain-containing protein n=1 Tax=Handroanthus impetiginosus TaxID=429701 RepID=A0A2G9HJE1_9LAMI|nr:hypothetical protein CDL12_09685 [Handroanthus impetiginosus]
MMINADELTIHTEARSCHSRGKHYHGRCYFRNQINNCKIICRREKFMTGKCIRATCYCMSKCEVRGAVRHVLHHLVARAEKVAAVVEMLEKVRVMASPELEQLQRTR